MLEIINNLKPFFEDCYRRVNVREYSRIMKFSPPTASKILSNLKEEGLLEIEKDRNYFFYYANKSNWVFIQLSRIYWSVKLKELVDSLEKVIVSPTILLFGSLSKGEAKKDSDVDICIFGEKKIFNLDKFEKKLKRKIQIFFFDSFFKMKNKELANSIINGCLLKGRLKV